MPIHFSCKSCNKPLFAQDRFAGRVAKCPRCGTENAIPSVAAHAVVDGRLIDMERVTPATSPENPLPEGAPRIENHKSALEQLKELTAAATAEPLDSSESPSQPAPVSVVESSAPVPAPAAASEPTKRCPMCAETIKAAARKCRFCGAILDPDLRDEIERERQVEAATQQLAAIERNVGIWRVLAVIATSVTSTWLLLLTLSNLGTSPAVLTIFNFLLIFGLMWSTRQMRHGPARVFTAAAVAIVVCMPLNIEMGLPLNETEMLEAMKQVNPQQSEKLTVDDVRGGMLALYTMVGALISIPVWLAALKVAALTRIRARFAKATKP